MLTDRELLLWIHERFRLIHFYKESENTDFVEKLKLIALKNSDSVITPITPPITTYEPVI